MHYAIGNAKPEGATVRYVIETKGSSFSVRAFATGFLSSLAHDPVITIPGFTGEVFLDPSALENSSVRIVVDAASLTPASSTPAKDREELNRRMHGDVIESDSYSEIIYECARVSASQIGEGQYWAAVNGELSLHGVTHQQAVSARISVLGETLRAVGECTLRLSDYAIRPVTAVGGAIKLKDEIKLSFDMTARRAT